MLRLRRQSEAFVACSMRVEPVFPKCVESAAGVDTTQGQDVFSTRLAPEHGLLFASGTDDRLAVNLGKSFRWSPKVPC